MKALVLALLVMACASAPKLGPQAMTEEQRLWNQAQAMLPPGCKVQGIAPANDGTGEYIVSYVCGQEV